MSACICAACFESALSKGLSSYQGRRYREFLLRRAGCFRFLPPVAWGASNAQSGDYSS
ncbi:hypothetical protein EHS19_08855 [Bifidobacterium jacchi]|uniref:Uncharacterized protein n=1 Tax=Bifidobacterium jacchi TaxID=2490545 RepID=A0A5N5REG9_9BIFI|nr:hypothetical protein EHS19_08855 [Bifidobacterium jacchi]